MKLVFAPFTIQCLAASQAPATRRPSAFLPVVLFTLAGLAGAAQAQFSAPRPLSLVPHSASQTPTGPTVSPMQALISSSPTSFSSPSNTGEEGSFITLQAAPITFSMQPLNSFSPNGDGWLSPAEQSFLTDGTGATSTVTQRGLAYNPTNNHLYVTSRTGIGASPRVGVFDGTTGTFLSELSTANITGGGSGILAGVGVSADGFVYVSNVSSSANGSTGAAYKVYRYADEFSNPSQINFSTFSMQSKRLGDEIDIIGSDADNSTRLVAGYSGAAGYSIVIPSLLDASYAGVGATDSFKGGVAFVDGNTVWGTPGGASTVNRSKTDGTLLGTSALTTIYERQIDITNVNGTWLLATLESSGTATNNGMVRIYDITNSVTNGVNTITLLGALNLVGTQMANGNNGGAITFGPVSGNDVTVYAMSTNNGVEAIKVTVPPVPEPASAALLVGALGVLAVRRQRR